MRYLLIFLTVFCTVHAFAAHLPSLRDPHQSYLEEAFELMPSMPADAQTPWSLQRPLGQLDQTSVPVLGSLAQVQKVFAEIRDLRAWSWNDRPGFARRIPWLYVDDGCFLRAEMIVEKFREWGYSVPKQVMAFGDLRGDSAYGSVTWWFHVAPVVKVGSQSYVLDPSMDATHPLSLEEWTLRMAPVSAAKLSICNADVVDPQQYCFSTEANWDTQYETEQLQLYLGLEWDKLQAALGVEPIGPLGDTPPWTQNRH